MSVVTSLPAIPNRMQIVWSYLRSVGPGGADADELKKLLGPRSLQSAQGEDAEDDGSATAISDHVINEMRNLGLVSRAANGHLALMPAAFDAFDLLQFFERRLLDPVEAEKYGQGSFPLALAWFLSQDPTIPFVWGHNYANQVIEECGAESRSFELTNHSRFEQFVYWARYLGFAWRLDLEDSRAVLPDASHALARHLPSILPAKTPRTIQEVMAELARHLPVLEGGEARKRVESLLSPEKRRPPGQLSRSTSFALERLEIQRKVVLERVHDAPALNLDRASGPKAISHITWQGSK